MNVTQLASLSAAVVALASCSLKAPSIRADDLSAEQGVVIASSEGEQCSNGQDYVAWNLKSEGIKPGRGGMMAHNRFLTPPYIHALKLKPGRYILYYSAPGINTGTLLVSSGYASLNLEFEVRPGEVSYIGNLQLRCPPTISVGDQFDRDVDYVIEHSPELDRAKVVKRLAEPPA
jgi:hypothetical protein